MISNCTPDVFVCLHRFVFLCCPLQLEGWPNIRLAIQVLPTSANKIWRPAQREGLGSVTLNAIGLTFVISVRILCVSA